MRIASSMIELVIAIVVMGIAIMALPLMLTTTQENNAYSMQQESILATRTQIGDMLTYPWDENSINNGYVLDTNSTNFKRSDVNSTRRIGHIKADKRRKYGSTIKYASINLGLNTDPTNPTLNDIDDFITTLTPKTLNLDTNRSLDYKLDFNMTTNVLYIDDNFILGSTFVLSDSNTTSGGTTNIKMIELHAQGDNIDFKLRAYSTNIGESELLRKPY